MGKFQNQEAIGIYRLGELGLVLRKPVDYDGWLDTNGSGAAVLQAAEGLFVEGCWRLGFCERRENVIKFICNATWADCG